MSRVLVISAIPIMVAVAIKELFETIEGILAAIEGICKRLKAIRGYFRSSLPQTTRRQSEIIVAPDQRITPSHFRDGFWYGIGFLFLMVLAISVVLHGARQLRSSTSV